MPLVIETKEGRTIRQASQPDVVSDPRLKNYLWIKTSVPPATCLWNDSTSAWVCSDGLTNNGVVLTQLASVTFSPGTGSVAEGFSMSHGAVGVTIMYSINGGLFVPYSGGVLLVGSGYFYVAAYASKPGYADSPVDVAEYVT